MTPAQFAALAQLLRIQAGPSREAARLVLVDGMQPAHAAAFTGLSASGVGKVTARMRADAHVQPGQNHQFAFNLDKAVLFDPVSTHRI